MGIVLLVACQERQGEPRRYQEISFVSSDVFQGSNPSTSRSNSSQPTSALEQSLTWATPDGWQERGAGGMRLATFVVTDGKTECTIIAFPGSVGGLNANVVRWLGQLKIELGEDELSAFISSAQSFEAAGGWKGEFFNFNRLLSDKPGQTTSMLVSILTWENSLVFVKLMGEKDLMSNEEEAFLSLCKSLK